MAAAVTVTSAAPPRAPMALPAPAAERYLIFDGLHYSPAQLELASRSPVPVRPPEYSYDEIRLTRARDGHYYLSGSINGFPVVFLIDTGASMTSISTSTARNAGIRAGKSSEFQGAGGKLEGAITHNNEIIVGGVRLNNMAVAAMATLNRPLLGMNALRFFTITQEGETMLLRLTP